MFGRNFWKNLNALSWIDLRSFRPERKIFYRSEHRWGLWEEDGSGRKTTRDFRLKRDILSVWNILIGHSRMVKNDSRMNRNQILKWETFYFKTTNYTSTDQNQTSHTFYADTLRTRVFTQFNFIKIVTNLPIPGPEWYCFDPEPKPDPTKNNFWWMLGAVNVLISVLFLLCVIKTAAVVRKNEKIKTKCFLDQVAITAVPSLFI